MDNRTGGAYAVIDGELKQTEAPTIDHPEGNRPRDSEGRALDVPGQGPAPAEKPTEAAPADATDNIKRFRRGSPPAPADQPKE